VAWKSHKTDMKGYAQVGLLWQPDAASAAVASQTGFLREWDFN
jgi:hypothetical protein